MNIVREAKWLFEQGFITSGTSAFDAWFFWGRVIRDPVVKEWAASRQYLRDPQFQCAIVEDAYLQVVNAMSPEDIEALRSRIGNFVPTPTVRRYPNSPRPF